MIKIEKVEVWGFEHAIRGMRNPMNSWDKSDSQFADSCTVSVCPNTHFPCYECVGENDLDLMQRLYKAGTEHRKYLRQIFVSMDITAPLYWWKEADQYRIGVTTNSCSTMHKIHAKPFELDDFSHEHVSSWNMNTLKYVIGCLNADRENYLITKDKDYWWQLIQLLPSSYNQRRTITMNYENVMTIINQRKGHKLDEWNDLVEELYKLPYVREIRGE